MEKTEVTVNFRTTREHREWFRNAAYAERMPLSEWLRRLAVSRATELVPQPSAERAAR